MESLELAAAQGVIGLAVVQTLNMYQTAAPKLADLRKAPSHDHTMRQLILDADLYGGIAVLVIGGGAALLSRQMLPLLLASSGLLLVSLYYRSVLNSPTPEQIVPAPTKGEQS